MDNNVTETLKTTESLKYDLIKLYDTCGIRNHYDDIESVYNLAARIHYLLDRSIKKE